MNVCMWVYVNSEQWAQEWASTREKKCIHQRNTISDRTLNSMDVSNVRKQYTIKKTIQLLTIERYTQYWITWSTFITYILRSECFPYVQTINKTKFKKRKREKENEKEKRFNQNAIHRCDHWFLLNSYSYIKRIVFAWIQPSKPVRMYVEMLFLSVCARVLVSARSCVGLKFVHTSFLVRA